MPNCASTIVTLFISWGLINLFYEFSFFRRPLLFQTSEDIVSNPALGESLPHSVVLHHLFSRAPNELKSPHEVYHPVCYQNFCVKRCGHYVVFMVYEWDSVDSISPNCNYTDASDCGHCFQSVKRAVPRILAKFRHGKWP